MPIKISSTTKTKTSSEAPTIIKNLLRIKRNERSIKTIGINKTVNYRSRIYNIVKNQAIKLLLASQMYPTSKLSQLSTAQMSGVRVNPVAQTMTKNNLRAKSSRLKLRRYLIRRVCLKKLQQVSIRRSSKNTCCPVSKIP